MEPMQPFDQYGSSIRAWVVPKRLRPGSYCHMACPQPSVATHVLHRHDKARYSGYAACFW